MKKIDAPDQIPDGRHYAIMDYSSGMTAHYVSTDFNEVQAFIKPLKMGRYAVLEVNTKFKVVFNVTIEKISTDPYADSPRGD